MPPFANVFENRNKYNYPVKPSPGATRRAGLQTAVHRGSKPEYREHIQGRPQDFSQRGARFLGTKLVQEIGTNLKKKGTKLKKKEQNSKKRRRKQEKRRKKQEKRT